MRLRPPRAGHRAALPATVVAVLLIGLAVVSAHDLAVREGWTGGPSWTLHAARWVDGLQRHWWTTSIGVLLVLVGLALAVDAVRPSRRTHRRTALDDDVWVSDRALRTLARAAAENTPGVAKADVSTGRRVVRVSLTTEADGTVERARAAVLQALSGFVADERQVRVAEVHRAT